MFSSACNYGLRACLYIASQENRLYIPIGEISKNLDISFHFLTKILQKLSKENILASFKGPKGGIKLSRPAEEITLAEIILAIDGTKFFDQCILGLEECNDKSPCPLHDDWIKLRKQIQRMLEQTSLMDLTAKMKMNKFRLSNLS
jgi:Rrf2 family protein